MTRYIVTITYTVDGKKRTVSPPSIAAETPLDAQLAALQAFAARKDGHRVLVLGITVR